GYRKPPFNGSIF
uniref:FMRFamide-like neuropeptide FLP7 n=2 Tax=Pancrustacea TaxID=197562 RepID=FAR7_PENMO|nr:RecName: Full=FMRFamide-like neuropeptide FLP7; AltName: Full=GYRKPPFNGSIF-amide [Penaeus monodon]